MEPFVDFGLLEMCAATGLGWLARRIYATRLGASVVLLASLVAPAFLIFIIASEIGRWIAALCLATSLLNVTVLFPLVRSDRLPELLARKNLRQM
jgi:hypothetical protein